MAFFDKLKHYTSQTKRVAVGFDSGVSTSGADKVKSFLGRVSAKRASVRAEDELRKGYGLKPRKSVSYFAGRASSSFKGASRRLYEREQRIRAAELAKRNVDNRSFSRKVGEGFVQADRTFQQVAGYARRGVKANMSSRRSRVGMRLVGRSSEPEGFRGVGGFF